MSVIDLHPDQRFHLNDSFVDSYRSVAPDWGPVGEVTFLRTYSRKKDGGGQERWYETLRRVVQGCYTVQKWHCLRNHLPWSEDTAQQSAQTMYDLFFTMLGLPPGRGLWIMGTEYMYDRGGAACNNCGFVSTANISNDFSDPACWLMDMSMLGVGVGFDTKGAGTKLMLEPNITEQTHHVPDTREGWVELIKRCLDAHVGIGTIPKRIDVSDIRPAGAPIKGFGGTAAGPEPLLELVESVKDLLGPYRSKFIDSTGIVDLKNHVGKCVVAGNVRRSAEIALGDSDDEPFLNLKNPEIWKEELQDRRWVSNNSVIVKPGQDYSKIGHRTAINGEPGYFWLENAQRYGRMVDPPDNRDLRASGTNPCSEQTLEDRELCCLAETFPALHDNFEQWRQTLKYLYLYAKTVTLIPTHDPGTNAVQMRNRRIGLSQAGVALAFSKRGHREHFSWCDKGYGYVTELDKRYSDWLCIPRSIKMTSIKPGGTTPLLVGVPGGLSNPTSQYYYRTIRIAIDHPLIPKLEKAGYRIEPCLSSPQRTLVVYFPCCESLDLRTESEISMWEQLATVAQMQRYWADNQVSCTIMFRKDEAQDIPRALELYDDQLKSVAFLPQADHGYKQAPYIPISREEFEAAKNDLQPIEFDYSKDTHDLEDKYCSGEACEIAGG